MTCKTSTKTIGIILEALALPILIIVAVLLNLPDKDLGAITVLLIFGICIFLTGILLRYGVSASSQETSTLAMKNSYLEIKSSWWELEQKR